MLKKISTKDLKVGTFVADIGRNWLNHPWKTKSKTITTFKEIQELLDHGIDEVTIDLSKSEPDVASATSPPKILPHVKTVTHKAPTQKTPEIHSAVLEEMPKAVLAYNGALDTSKALLAACRMNKKIELEIVQENVNNLVDSVSRNRDALIALKNLRQADDYTYTHCLNVSVLAISTGKSLGLSDKELQILGMGTMLHDLGKTRIPGYILNKPGKLTDKEFSIMRSHAQLSGQIISEQKMCVDEQVYQIARHHHERMDGSGYPDNLQGSSITTLVTICAISDVYDALTSDRVYHKGRHPQDALKLIYSLRDTHFPAKWVDRFVQSVGIYPPGTMVRLNTEQVAVVTDTNPSDLTTPTIKLVANENGMIYSQPRLVDLAESKDNDGLVINSVISRQQAGFDPAYYFKPPKKSPLC